MKTIITFLGVWFVASLLNGALSGVCIAFADAAPFYNSSGTVVLSVIFSFIFSAPLVGIVWLITTITQSSGQTGFAVFQVVLKSTLICSLAGAMFFIYAFGNEFKDSKYSVGFSIIVSAVSAVLIFRKQLKTTA